MPSSGYIISKEMEALLLYSHFFLMEKRTYSEMVVEKGSEFIYMMHEIHPGHNICENNVDTKRRGMYNASHGTNKVDKLIAVRPTVGSLSLAVVWVLACLI